MLDGIKNKIRNIKEDRARAAHEMAIKEAEQEAERIAKEKARIQAEKDRLMAMDEKELQIELIMAVRGFYADVQELHNAEETLQARLAELEENIEKINSDIDGIQNDITSLNSRVEY